MGWRVQSLAWELACHGHGHTRQSRSSEQGAQGREQSPQQQSSPQSQLSACGQPVGAWGHCCVFLDHRSSLLRPLGQRLSRGLCHSAAEGERRNPSAMLP